jgi:hypothetical protein
MSLFDYFRSDEEDSEDEELDLSEPDNVVTKDDPEHPDNDEGEEEEVDVRVTEILRHRHTVHLGEAEFTDGDVKRYMFDAMKRKSGHIVLYDYTSFSGRGASSEAFVSIVPDNLKTFETVRREEVRVRTGLRERDMGPFTPDEAEEYAEKMRGNKDIESVKVLD